MTDHSPLSRPLYHLPRQGDVILPPGLYLVATPIGNLADISLRALEILSRADWIACEDTRVSQKLLSAYGIKQTLLAYHDHNGAQMRPKIVTDLQAGKTIALISDAGSPLISDPGHKLVQTCLAHDLPLFSVPGACAPIVGLQLSGLTSERFLFNGFLPTKQKARQDQLQSLSSVPATLIFFENAQRLHSCLEDIQTILGPRQVCVARELSKKFEEYRRDCVTDLIAHYKQAGPPKGEIVVIVAPPEQNSMSDIEIETALRQALQHARVKEAAQDIAELSGRPRKEIYQLALRLKDQA